MDIFQLGQTTKYFYKFDVVGNEILTEADGPKTYSSSQFYNHQYMTNLRDPSSQAGSLYDIYADSQILDDNLTFTIPVYDNMPAEQAAAPTTLRATPEYGLYYVNSLKKWGITLRDAPSTSGSSLGNLYKDTVVLHMGTIGSWGKVKIYKITGFNSANKKWDYTEQIGYVSNEYLQRVGRELPDYRGQVDMGAGNSTGNSGEDSNESGENNSDPGTLVIIGNTDFKIEENNLIVTPPTKCSDVIAKYPSSIIKKADGTVISDMDDFIGTGMTAVIDNQTYNIAKLGDANGDGILNSADLLRIQKHLLKVIDISDGVSGIAADPSKDGIINSADLLKIQKYLLKVSNIDL